MDYAYYNRAWHIIYMLFGRKGDFMDIHRAGTPRKHRTQRIFLQTLLWSLGRSLQTASVIDPAIRELTARLPERYVLALSVHQENPAVVIEKNPEGTLSARGRIRPGGSIDLLLDFHTIAGALLMLTCRESTAHALVRDRLQLIGDQQHGCTVIRMLDRLAVMLLPSSLAQKAVKRYLSPTHKHAMRAKLYLCAWAGR